MLLARFGSVVLLMVSACSGNSNSETSNAGTTSAMNGAETSNSTTSAEPTSTTNTLTTASTSADTGSSTSSGGSTSTNSGGSTSTNSTESTSSAGAGGGTLTVTSGSGGTSTAPLGAPVEAERAAMPFPRSEHGVAALNGEVYVLGGFTPTVTSSVQVYSPESDSWRDAADFPVVFHHPNVAAVDGLLYVLGFHAGQGQRVGDGQSFAYDPMTDEWSPRASMPQGTERGAGCITPFEGKIYVFGGTNDGAMAESSVYDPQQDSWEPLPLLPAFRHHCVAAVIGGKIYIVSGRDVVIQEVQAESYVFDPVARSYQEVAPILTPRGGAAGGVLHGRIYVFGGEGNVNDPMQIFHEVEQYDPVTDSWSALPDMNVPRHGLGGAVIGDRIYLPGGSTSIGIDAQATHSVFYFEPP